MFLSFRSETFCLAPGLLNLTIQSDDSIRSPDWIIRFDLVLGTLAGQGLTASFIPFGKNIVTFKAMLQLCPQYSISKILEKDYETFLFLSEY